MRFFYSSINSIPCSRLFVILYFYIKLLLSVGMCVRCALRLFGCIVVLVVVVSIIIIVIIPLSLYKYLGIPASRSTLLCRLCICLFVSQRRNI